jgi:dCTP deaminase
MVLSNQDIQKLIEENKIQINPAPNYRRTTWFCFFDLRLGDEFAVFEHTKKAVIDYKEPRKL